MITPSLNEADRKRIGAAVAETEAASAGEIVTILSERSDNYTDVALAWCAIAAMLAMTALAIAPDFYLGLYEQLTGLWAHEWQAGAILTLGAAVAGLKFLSVWLVQLWSPLKFLLIPPQIKAARVRARAVTCFKVGAERRTHGRTGILIYLSIREHRAEIVADEAIVARVAPEVWGDAMAAMLTDLHEGRVADGMIAAIERVGAVLAEHFPRDTNDINELPDRLIEV